jgi:hypothetical protein
VLRVRSSARAAIVRITTASHEAPDTRCADHPHGERPEAGSSEQQPEIEVGSEAGSCRQRGDQALERREKRRATAEVVEEDDLPAHPADAVHFAERRDGIGTTLITYAAYTTSNDSSGHAISIASIFDNWMLRRPRDCSRFSASQSIASETSIPVTVQSGG